MKKTKIIGIVMMLIFLAPTVLGLGIAPARKTLDFVPNSEQTITYKVYNSDRQTFDAQIELSDALAKIARVEPKVLSFTEDDTVKPFDVKLKFGKYQPANGKITVTALGTASTVNVQISSALTIMATGNIVVEENNNLQEETNIKEVRSWLTYVLGAVIALLVVGNVVFFVMNKRTPTQTITQAKISTPHEVVRETEVRQEPIIESRVNNEIEDEIERLRKLM